MSNKDETNDLHIEVGIGRQQTKTGVINFKILGDDYHRKNQ